MKRVLQCIGAVVVAVGGAQIGSAGPDVTFCQLYGVQNYGRVAPITAFAGATTSWNETGTEPLIWFGAPDSRHPKIAQNFYKLENDRLRQVGQSWCKNGFFALDNSQCTTSCIGTGGSSLGLGCTDTYSAFLNAQQAGNTGNSPRYEIDPWTGAWDYSTSITFTGGIFDNPITRRLQVLDADMQAGGTYFYESYYVHRDDTNHMNSAAWVNATVSGGPGSWSIGTPPSNVQPNIGFAIDAWAGATQTVIAQEIPVVELESPDGRSILAAKAIDLGGGQWRYEYALLNVDMAAQVDAFAVPVPGGANVSGVGMHAVRHHDEPTNVVGGTPIDNSAWTFAMVGDAVTWSTTSNPLRWGTLNNFWFECDVAPGTAVAQIGQVFDRGEHVLSGMTVAPAEAFGAEFVETPEAVQAGDVTIQVQTFTGSESAASGSVEYTISGAGGSSGSATLVDLGGGLWEATIPGVVCGQTIAYHAEFTGSGGTTLSLPLRGSDERYSAQVGEISEVFADDFSTDLGWTTDFNSMDTATGGFWERGDAIFQVNMPEKDKTGDGKLLVTGQAANYNEFQSVSDVDDGETSITSPVLDLSDSETAWVSYWRWFNNSRGFQPQADDTLRVEVSNNDGATWTTVETVGGLGPNRYGEWFRGEFEIPIALSSEVRVRFVAQDEDDETYVDAAIDDFRVVARSCTNPVLACDGDANGDQVVDVNDISYVLFRLGNAGSPGSVDGDANGDGTVDVNDISYVLFRLGPC